ncbi:hypothetical protein B0H15DRAFT_947916 [Mycena belliarum]|uniref:Uncharacterized protein n=1 Tax=Mycena belliarum TaxID=1033014 RepID=A0AAD6XNZ7_9AGAR|nr:hypothetical protein B0H15DRAFT_947916 [Mycena belliae]
MSPPKSFAITNWQLTAECAGSCSRAIPLQDVLGCNKDGYLGPRNEAGFDWARLNTAWRWYNATYAPSVCLRYRLVNISYRRFKVWTVIDLSTLFDDVNGTLKVRPKAPAVLFIEPGSQAESEFMRNLEASTKFGTVKDSLFQTSIAYDPPESENYTLFYAKAAVEAEGQFLFKTYNNEAKAAVMNIFQKNGIRAEQVDFDIIQAKVSGQFGTYVGFNAALNLVSGQVGPFDATLGVGVATGVGVRDEAVELKLLGCGFTVGKRIGISVAGTSVEINFGRFFPDQS